MARRVGSAFTGEEDEADSPIKNILSNDGPLNPILGDPASRAALLQIGLNLMQPTAMGQTTGGAIAQAVGSGGEVEARLAKEEFERQKHEDELDKSQRTLDIRQQEANAYSRAQEAATARGERTDKLTLQQLKDNATAARLGTKNHHDAAVQTFKAIQDRQQNILYDPVKAPDPLVEKYKGKTIPQIEKMMRDEDPEDAAVTPPGARGVPTPRDRVVGQTYDTPKGPLKWNGSGWEQP